LGCKSKCNTVALPKTTTTTTTVVEPTTTTTTTTVLEGLFSPQFNNIFN
jgi:hypothetical protein